MGKYESDARQLLELVGGKGNIGAVTHCITRMRLCCQIRQRQTSKGLRLFQVLRAPLHRPDSFRSLSAMTYRRFTMTL